MDSKGEGWLKVLSDMKARTGGKIIFITSGPESINAHRLEFASDKVSVLPGDDVVQIDQGGNTTRYIDVASILQIIFE